MSSRTESLLAAAVAGLFAGCGGDDPTDRRPRECPQETAAPTGDTGDSGPTTTGPVVTFQALDEEITYAEFAARCTDRHGKLQTHATCAGNNACAGFHFNKGSKMYMEHTCKAFNSCGGISCVYLPEDQGRSGEELYNNYCGPACHGGTDIFTVWVHPDDDAEATVERLIGHSMEWHTTMLAFGSRGMNANGTAYANVPHRYETMSVAELERVMTHLLALPMVTETFSIVGITEDLN
jgi:hypothetical protein